MSSWIAAATSYSVSDTPMIPFYIYYSMFGFQRIGDLAWAAGDSRARGFLVGGTAGRTTLNGEGLQHEDGHSHLLSATIPNCVGPDLRARGRGDRAGRPAPDVRRTGGRLLLPDGDERELPASGHAGGPGGRGSRGHHPRHVPAAGGAGREEGRTPGSAAGLRNHPARGDRGRRAAGTGLRRDRRRVERAQLHRAAPRRHRRGPLEHAASGRAARLSFAQQCLAGRLAGPVVAATDYMRAFADQIRPYIDRRFRVLGTDGFGVRTTGAICAGTSRSTGTTSRSPR